jgi:hypothetical protein
MSAVGGVADPAWAKAIKALEADPTAALPSATDAAA